MPGKIEARRRKLIVQHLQKAPGRGISKNERMVSLPR